MTKSKDCKLDLVKGQASRPYKRIGRYLLLTKRRVTSSEAQRPVLFFGPGKEAAGNF